jgi:alkylation response protein AidB-like acyl-CoA dehydrogenase
MEATFLERAKALYDVIRGEARESELARRLTDRAAQALLDAKLCSMLVARSNGGLEASRAEFFETVEAIAKADDSAGWCLSVCATIGHAHKSGPGFLSVAKRIWLPWGLP